MHTFVARWISSETHNQLIMLLRYECRNGTAKFKSECLYEKTRINKAA